MFAFQEKENQPQEKREQKKNHTGIPAQLKQRMEETSGFSFDDVRVHYNSDKPQALDALAYTQGNQVYLGPGQERHLPHELGHVVQQKMGIVHADTTHPSGARMNTDAALERQADEIGVGRGVLQAFADHPGHKVVQLCNDKKDIGGGKSRLQEATPDAKIKSNQDRSNAQKAANPDVQSILDNYPVIEGEHSYTDDIKATNPNYAMSRKAGDKSYTYNCQRCVNAYEARRRGYDVTAGKRLSGNDTLPKMNNAKGWANVYENGVNELIPCHTSKTDDIQQKVSQQILSWGDGARGIVRVQWEKGGGHVFIGECHDKNVVFLDPQNANMDASGYFSFAKTDKTYVLRTDNKQFSTLIQECCEHSTKGGVK